MRVLQINSLDVGGDAETIARALHLGARKHGHESWLAVGRTRGSELAGVVRVPTSETLGVLRGPLFAIADGLRPLTGRVRGAGKVRVWLDRLARQGALADWWHGREDFNFPGTAQVFGKLPGPPDLVHCHNLHGGYFDLRLLPGISRRVPTVLTLHDAWLLSGHCAHSFDCERWKSGCGACPDLTIFPAVRRDATAENWRRKKAIFANSRFFLAAPSAWLMERIESSMLKDAAVQTRVIPNGVDTEVFCPGDLQEARAVLGLPRDAVILIIASNGLRNNRWRDFSMLSDALNRLNDFSSISGASILCFCVGEEAPEIHMGDIRMCFVPPIEKAEDLAIWYRAADIGVYPSRVDTFPTAVIEALASGLPVAASAAGGIPEQIRDADQGVHEATGFLAPRGNSEAMARAIESLIDDKDLRRKMGQAARRDVESRFSRVQQIRTYLNWYAEILDTWQNSGSALNAECGG